MIDEIGQIRKFDVDGVQMRSVISYTITQTGRMRVTLFCRFDVNSMAHVYVMHVCKFIHDLRVMFVSRQEPKCCHYIV